MLSLLIVVEHCDNALPLHQGEQNLGLVLHLEDRRLRFSWDEIFGSIWGWGEGTLNPNIVKQQTFNWFLFRNHFRDPYQSLCPLVFDLLVLGSIQGPVAPPRHQVNLSKTTRSYSPEVYRPGLHVTKKISSDS